MHIPITNSSGSAVCIMGHIWICQIKLLESSCKFSENIIQLTSFSFLLVGNWSNASQIFKFSFFLIRLLWGDCINWLCLLGKILGQNHAEEGEDGEHSLESPTHTHNFRLRLLVCQDLMSVWTSYVFMCALCIVILSQSLHHMWNWDSFSPARWW